MKKLFSMIALALLCLTFSACNEDAEKNDPALSQEIVGRWVLYFSSDNTSDELRYYFGEDGKFIYQTTSLKSGDMTAKSTVVRGNWDIYKGVLELKYDLDSFESAGLSESEIYTYKDAYNKENMMLEDMNKGKHPYGPTVTFEYSGGTEIMRLSNINGAFTRIRY